MASHKYVELLQKIKRRITVSQYRVMYAANEEMLRMYWEIGGILDNSQKSEGVGT